MTIGCILYFLWDFKNYLLFICFALAENTLVLHEKTSQKIFSDYNIHNLSSLLGSGAPSYGRCSDLQLLVLCFNVSREIEGLQKS